MTFAAFFMAEYANMVTVCSVATLLFLGGWHPLWPAALGSIFVAPAILAGCRRDLPVSRPASGASVRPHTRCRSSRVVFFGLAGLMLFPPLVPVLTPLFWFLAKLSFLLFRFHLDSRHAAPVPLRPADELRVEIPVPCRAGEPSS